MSDQTATLRPRADMLQRAAGGAQADTRVEPGMLEQIASAARLEQDATNDAVRGRRAAGYEEIMTALEERGYSRADFERSYDTAMEEAGLPGFLSPIEAGGLDYQRIWQAAQAEGLEGLPASREEYERWLVNRRDEAASDMDVLARGEGADAWLARFTGASSAGMAESNLGPFQFIFGLGGRTIGASMLREGAVAGVDETINIPDRMANMRQLGRPYSAHDAALDVLGASGGAALLTGGGQVFGRYVLPAAGQRFDQFFANRAATPQEQAALDVLQREAELDEASPFVRNAAGDAEFRDRLEESAAALAEGRALAERAGFDREAVKQAIRGPESAGNDGAVNAAGSSASGRYQFIQSTFEQLYQREFGASAQEAARAWRERRFDVQVQERLMDRLLDDNAAVLRNAGFATDTGNLYLAHFAGAETAVRMLRANPDARVDTLFSRAAIEQNPTYLGGDRSVGEAIAAIREAVGAPAATRTGGGVVDGLEEVAGTGAIEAARIDQARVEQELPGILRPLVDDRSVSLNRHSDLASELGVEEDQLRRALDELVMQGHITRTKSGIYRRPTREGPEDALRFVASRGGIHPTGLGPRARATGNYRGDRLQDSALNYFVPRRGPLLREDGRGIDDMGEALWEAGYFGPPDTTARPTENEVVAFLEESIRKGEKRYSFLDNVQPPDQPRGRRGRFQSDEHEEFERTRWSAAGQRVFGRELTDDELFAAMDLELRVPEWRVLDEFDEEEALDAALVMMADRQLDEALESAYLEIEDEFYDAVEAQFRDAAGREGEAGTEGSGGSAPDSGDARAGEAGGGTRAGAAQESQLTRSPDPDNPAMRGFDEADGEAVRSQAESDWHDIRNQMEDPAVQARLRELAQLQAEAPLRGENATGQAQDGTMGTPLFDAADQPLFDLGDGAGPRTITEIEAEIAADKQAVDMLRNCMK